MKNRNRLNNRSYTIYHIYHIPQENNIHKLQKSKLDKLHSPHRNTFNSTRNNQHTFSTFNHQLLHQNNTQSIQLIHTQGLQETLQPLSYTRNLQPYKAKKPTPTT